MRVVGAEVSRHDSRGQVTAQRGNDLSDSVDTRFDLLRDGRTPVIGFESQYGHEHCSEYLLGDLDA